MRTTDAAIIGAGPYGLSISAHLSARGIEHEIFGRPMSSWRDYMPADMVLRSEPLASNLWDPQRRYTLQRFCAERSIPYVESGRPLPISQFLDYAEWFLRHAVPRVHDRQVTKLAQVDDDFQIEFSDGEIWRAKNVVVATGHRAFRHMPAVLSALPKELASHSSDHSDLSHFNGKDVVVVGAGQSSLETAALLNEHGAKVRIIARRNRISWNAENLGERTLFQKITSPESGLGFGWRSVAAAELPQVFARLPRALRFYIVRRTWGPSGAWWLKDRVVGKIPIFTGCELTGANASEGKVTLALQRDGTPTDVSADHVVAATGFKGDLARLSYLDPALKERIVAFNGVPKLDRFSESSVPGLFFVGMLAAPTFGPVMRFMFGAKHAAPMLARRLAKQSRRPMAQGIVVVAKD